VKRVTYLSVAEAELAEAAQYYDEQQSGLGRDFLDAVRVATAAIQGNPELWAFYEKPVRAYRVQPLRVSVVLQGTARPRPDRSSRAREPQTGLLENPHNLEFYADDNRTQTRAATG